MLRRKEVCIGQNKQNRIAGNRRFRSIVCTLQALNFLPRWNRGTEVCHWSIAHFHICGVPQTGCGMLLSILGPRIYWCFVSIFVHVQTQGTQCIAARSPEACCSFQQLERSTQQLGCPWRLPVHNWLFICLEHERQRWGGGELEHGGPYLIGGRSPCYAETILPSCRFFRLTAR